MRERGLALPLAFAVALATSGAAWADATARASSPLPIAFEANEGQADPRVRFVARGTGYTLFLTSTDAVLAHGPDAIRMAFRGASDRARIVPVERRPAGTNYLVGRDPTRWRRAVPTYAKVRYEAIYPGIDLVFYGSDRQLEYDLVVQPGADARKIRLAFDGARELAADGDGDLRALTRGGEIRLRKPTVYQVSADGRAPRAIEGRYRLVDGRTVAFDLGDYDRKKALVIDPVVVYSTYAGGFGGDHLRDGRQMIAVGPDGSAYVTGSTDSSDFPTTPGSFRPIPSVSRSATEDGREPCVVSAPFGPGLGSNTFVAKLSPDGSSLVYATYVGGTYTIADHRCIGPQDSSSGIAVDSAGSAYITGYTNSPDFPTTWGPTNSTLFITKLDPTGSSIVYSARPDPSGDTSIGIAVGADGSAYVTGKTSDGYPGFPVTPGAFQTVCHACVASLFGPSTDAFVLKLDPTGSAVAYATFLGGTGTDVGTGIAVDADGQMYVTGLTVSTDFPTTPGAPQTTAGADVGGVAAGDVFVTKLSADGSTAIFSTYLRSDAPDTPGTIAADSAGNAYVTGYTTSPGFPTTVGAYQRTLPPGPFAPTPAFVTKLTATGGLAYSTFLAGLGLNQGVGIAVDGAGRAYVVGATDAHTFPTVDATQPAMTDPYPGGGSTDAFVSVLNASGSDLVFSTFLGGPAFDYAQGVALGPDGSAYVVGVTSHDVDALFPTTPGAFQRSYGGHGDIFVSRIAIGPPPDTTPPVIGDVSDVVAEATSAAGAAVTFGLPGATDDVTPHPSVSAAPPSGSTFPLGTTEVTVTATDAALNASHKTFDVTVQDTTPPALSLPASIATDATTPAGAVVGYAASASDLVDGAVAAACSPASGATFPVGTTTVSCSPTDSRGNTGAGAFAVTVRGGPEIIVSLSAETSTAGFNQGSAILLNVAKSLTKGNTGAACNQLAAFVNKVQAQSGKALTAAQAAALTLSATHARGALGCP